MNGVDEGHGGFSLIELLVVVAISAIVLATAAPNLARGLEGVRLRSAAVAVAGAMLRARRNAVAEGRVWSVRHRREGRVEAGPVGGRPAPVAIPVGVDIHHWGRGGDLRFHPSGRAANGTVLLGVGDQRRRVVVNARGRVRVE